MSATGLPVFDETLQKTHVWLKEIMDEVGPDEQRAYHSLRAVLHALRDRLPVDHAAHLSAQLPMLVRGIYFEGWHPADKPNKERTRDAFLADVSERLHSTPPINPETATQSVFGVIGRHITPGELEQVRGALPADIQRLWPQGNA